MYADPLFGVVHCSTGNLLVTHGDGTKCKGKVDQTDKLALLAIVLLVAHFS